jgi:hypothetical protein
MQLFTDRARRVGGVLVLAALALLPVSGTPSPVAARPAAQVPPTCAIADPHEGGVVYFAPTGHTLRGDFLAYWTKYGGLAQFGYPITEEFVEPGPTAHLPQTVQYFERARFEHHPENGPPPVTGGLPGAPAQPATGTTVLLGLLGLQFHTPDPAVPAPAPGTPDTIYMPETGHTLGGPFRRYWEAHGGLFVNGYPISEPFPEQNPIDGKTYTVQYFQRARFELHPENAGTPYEVLLGLLGTQAAQKAGYFPPAGQSCPAVPPAAYPPRGHAADFSWIAGQVITTRIQGGCVYVQYDSGSGQVSPNGEAWSTALTNGTAVDGASVVLFGHLAQPGEPHEMCPGQAYLVDRVQANPAP